MMSDDCKSSMVPSRTGIVDRFRIKAMLPRKGQASRQDTKHVLAWFLSLPAFKETESGQNSTKRRSVIIEIATLEFLPKKSF